MSGTEVQQDSDGASPSAEKLPVYVDLDGTLSPSDLLWESILTLLGSNFFAIFKLIGWLREGKAKFKQRIADAVDLDIPTIPINQAFLAYLNDLKSKGHRIVLATASNQKYAEQLAAELGVFDGVIASDASVNCSGERKLARIKADAKGDFIYAGNDHVDVVVWQDAAAAIVVDASPAVVKAAENCTVVEKHFPLKKPGIKVWAKALRLHQWAKNALIFVPLVLAHKIDDPGLILQALVAFLAYGLTASSVYLLNDLLDLANDRHHKTKCKRPFAAGTLPIAKGAWAIPVLLVAAGLLALTLPIKFIGVLLFYYVVTVAYSFWLKRHALVDVFLLAGLYTLRLIAGSAAVQVELSFWLLSFSMFLFLSLAMVKRYTEVLDAGDSAKTGIKGRGYYYDDLPTIGQLGSASGYLAVLVMALYINSAEVTVLYSEPRVLWLICPIIMLKLN